MKQLLRALFDVLASLRVTVGLLLLSMVLVFAATLEQAHIGIWQVQERYFRSLVVIWTVPGSTLSIPVFPGGYVVGILLLANLLCAQAARLRFTWRNAGLQIAHLGIVVLLVGELITGISRKDGTLRLRVGQTKAYSEGIRSYELAFIEDPGSDGERVVAFPAEALARKGKLDTKDLPFGVSVSEYMPNASIREAEGMAGRARADSGLGVSLALESEGPPPAGADSGVPGAYIRISSPGGQMGSWLVSPFLSERQLFPFGGHEWEVLLRPARLSLPVSITLLGVTNDTYPGTDIPRNFSSRVRIGGGPAGEARETTISMNAPLRTGGYTFYQYQMNAPGGESVLEVVRDPSWLLPYVACAMMGFGLLGHFICAVVSFLGSGSDEAGRKPSAARGDSASGGRGPTLAAVAAAGVVLVSMSWSRDGSQGVTIARFGEIPVLVGGRVKPLDSVARTTLLLIQGRQAVDAPMGGLSAPSDPDSWLADVLFNPEKADQYPTFRVDSPEILETLGLTESEVRITYPDPSRRTMAALGLLPSRRTRFSFAQLRPGLAELGRQARLADSADSGVRTAYQRKVLETRDKVELYQRLKSSFQPPDLADFYLDLVALRAQSIASGVNPKEASRHLRREMNDRFTFMAQLGYLRPVPPSGPNAGGWRSVGAALEDSLASDAIDPWALDLSRIGHDWRTGDARDLDATVSSYIQRMSRAMPSVGLRMKVEALFNRAEPFYKSMLVYLAALMCGIASWLFAPRVLGRTAFLLLLLAWILATLGIGARMWIEGRPPVTNLYSSALFVGWAAVALCIGLNRVDRNAVGTVAAGAIGFSTLLIAHHLALAGDTLEMLRAVLDSNFWLATHVVVVTLGYASTFLAGFLALVYVARGMLTRSLDGETARAMESMVYGVVCFATLFSLVGTVLGGIWADQSWGRFWGWDPKENGALLIVLWNAVILHARWDKWIGGRGLMVMAVLGNIVTGWSWFGVNMLGIGLHSYGFTEAAFHGLIAFAASQLVIALAALTPMTVWRSFRDQPAP